jgi:hypothetical protein
MTDFTLSIGCLALESVIAIVIAIIISHRVAIVLGVVPAGLLTPSGPRGQGVRG